MNSIKLDQNILQWRWATDVATFRLWIHLLLKANEEDGYFMYEEIKMGQCVIGRKNIAEETGLSEQQIRTSLKKLEHSGEILIKSTNRYSVVTIVNYNEFSCKTNESTNKQPTSNQQATNEQPQYKELSINKKYKADENQPKKMKPELEYSNEFEQLWKYYLQNKFETPIGSKKDAWLRYLNLLKFHSHDKVQAHVEGYLAECNKNKCKTKHFTVFLNATDFRDNPEDVYATRSYQQKRKEDDIPIFKPY